MYSLFYNPIIIIITYHYQTLNGSSYPSIHIRNKWTELREKKRFIGLSKNKQTNKLQAISTSTNFIHYTKSPLYYLLPDHTKPPLSTYSLFPDYTKPPLYLFFIPALLHMLPHWLPAVVVVVVVRVHGDLNQ